MASRSERRKTDKLLARLTERHWNLLADIIEANGPMGPDLDDPSVMTTDACTPFLIPDDQGKGLARSLHRLDLVELVDEPGVQSGWVATKSGREALGERIVKSEARARL